MSGISKGAREKALRFLREVPRISFTNIKVRLAILRFIYIDKTILLSEQ